MNYKNLFFNSAYARQYPLIIGTTLLAAWAAEALVELADTPRGRALLGRHAGKIGPARIFLGGFKEGLAEGPFLSTVKLVKALGAAKLAPGTAGHLHVLR